MSCTSGMPSPASPTTSLGVYLPKPNPDTVVARSFAALEAGAAQVLADEATHAVKQGLNAEPLQ